MLKEHEKRNFLLNDIKLSSSWEDGKLSVQYAFDGAQICRLAYEHLWPVSHPVLTDILKKLNNGIVQCLPRSASLEKNDSELTCLFRTWFNEWKNGKGNWQPNTPYFILQTGLKLKDIHTAFQAYLQEHPTAQCRSVSKSYVSLLRAHLFPQIIKRKWCTFSECSACVRIKDQIAKSKSQEEKGAKRHRLDNLATFRC
jgi:hypothetical protein